MVKDSMAERVRQNVAADGAAPRTPYPKKGLWGMSRDDLSQATSWPVEITIHRFI
jgi:hypothetical protein